MFFSVFKGKTKESSGPISNTSAGGEAGQVFPETGASLSTDGNLPRTLSTSPLPTALEPSLAAPAQESTYERDDPYGLKPLAGPTEEAAEIDPRTPDIIAVHGIDGNAWNTWQHSNGRLWLKDFLPRHVPGARIYSFGYHAAVAFTRGRGDLKGFARSLLEGLNGVRYGEVIWYTSYSWINAHGNVAAPGTPNRLYLSQYGWSRCQTGKAVSISQLLSCRLVD